MNVKTHHTLKELQKLYHTQDNARLARRIHGVQALRGSQPRVVRQAKYEWLYVIGAVCPGTGQTVGLLSPNINTDITNVFFEQFCKEADPDVHVVMVWDMAGFHTSKDLKIPENVTIVALPPYSPELNPVENLWHYLRSHY